MWHDVGLHGPLRQFINDPLRQFASCHKDRLKFYLMWCNTCDFPKIFWHFASHCQCDILWIQLNQECMCSWFNTLHNVQLLHQLASLGEAAPGMVLVDEETLMKITVSIASIVYSQWRHAATIHPHCCHRTWCLSWRVMLMKWKSCVRRLDSE